MPEYREGEVSKSGKYIMRGGQWLPNTGGAGGAAQAPPLSPTGPPASPGVRAAVEQSIKHGTPIEPPGFGQKALGAVGTALDVLNLPHEYISKPVGEAIASKIPEGTVKLAPIGESGDVGREPYKFSPKEFAKEGLPFAIDFPVYGGINKAVKLGAGLLGKGLKKGVGLFSKAPATAEGPPLTEAVAPVDKDMQAFLGKFAKEQGIKLAPEDAQVVQQAESAAAQTLADTEPAAEFMGPLFGVGEREAVARPPNLRVLQGGVSPGAQGSLFPPAAISPPQYGPGRGLVGPPPPPPESFGGNVPRERLGTETARLKRAITDIERLRAIMGAK